MEATTLRVFVTGADLSSVGTAEQNRAKHPATAVTTAATSTTS